MSLMMAFVTNCIEVFLQKIPKQLTVVELTFSTVAVLQVFWK